jgi:hypothetical protein
LIQAHRAALGAQVAMQNFEGDYFRNNAQAPVYFTGHANQQQAQDNADLWNAQHQGSGLQHKPGFLWGQVDVKTVPLSMADAAFIDAKRLSVEDACRMWHWPHHLMELSGEQPLRNELAWTALFIKIYVRERLARIEAAFAADPDLFLGQPVYGQFLTDELERASEDVRAVTYKNWVQAGIFTPNEARAREGLPPIAGGDDIQFPIVGGGAPVNQPGDDTDKGASATDTPSRSLEPVIHPVQLVIDATQVTQAIDRADRLAITVGDRLAEIDQRARNNLALVERQEPTVVNVRASDAPAPPNVVVNVEPTPITVQASEVPVTVNVDAPEVTVENRVDVPSVTVEAGDVNVNVPDQPPAEVTVNVPEQPAPTVNVAAAPAPDVTVNVEPTPVTVEPPNVTVELAPARKVTVERDKSGRITGGTVQDT